MYAMKRTRADLGEGDEALLQEVKRQCRASSAAAFAAAFEEERLAPPYASAGEESPVVAESRRHTFKRTSEGEASEGCAAKRACSQPSPCPAPPPSHTSAATEQCGLDKNALSSSYIAGLRKGMEVARLHAERVVVPRAVERHTDHLEALFRQVIRHERACMVAVHDHEMAAVMGYVGGQLRTRPWGW